MSARTLATLAVVLALGACAALPTASLQAPAAWRAAGEPVDLPFQGGRRGGFALPQALGGGQVRFERGADRWTLFDRLQLDRAALRVQLQDGAGTDRDWTCRLRRTEAAAGVLQAPLQPPALDCRDVAGAELRLEERVQATRREQVGEYRDGGLRLAVRSVHRVEGSPLPLPDPGGFVIERDGTPVALVDLLGPAPRVRYAPLDTTTRPAVRDLVLLLGLAWDPARGP